MLFWEAKEVVIQVGVVKDADGIVAVRQSIDVGHGPGLYHRNGAFCDTGRRATFLAPISLKRPGIILDSDMNLTGFFDVVDRYGQGVGARREWQTDEQ